MAGVSLNFSGEYIPPNGGSVSLRFGEAPAEPVAQPVAAEVRLVVSPPRLRAVGRYDVNVTRPVTAQPGLRWERAAGLRLDRAGGWDSTARLRAEAAGTWQIARAASSGTGSLYEDLPSPPPGLYGVPWEVAARRPGAPAGDRWVYGSPLPAQLKTGVPWESARPLPGSPARTPWKVLAKLPRAPIRVPWEVARPRHRTADAPWNPGRRVTRERRVPWENARPLPTGRSPDVYIPPVVGPPQRVPDTHLNFFCPYHVPAPLDVRLNFGPHPCPGVIVNPDTGAYFILNAVTLKRLSDGAPIEIHAADVGIDSSSWCWSFRATVPFMEFEKVEPSVTGPVEVELLVNGLAWRFVVERYDRKEVHAKTDVTISGRSLTAYLDEPYAPKRSYVQEDATNSRQLAEAELERAGLVTGYTLDWRLIDALGWAMPAGTWSYNALTPVQVIQAIATGAGGFVNSDPSARQLLVLPEYPVPFWEWDASPADAVVDAGMVASRGLAWTEAPLYDGVLVSGVRTGVNARVRRAGTLGSFQAQPYVHAMISAIPAARQKGMSILSAGGKQAKVTLEIPFGVGLGLITPGKLLEVRDRAVTWRGLVRSTQINVSRPSGLVIRQLLEVERHYGE